MKLRLLFFTFLFSAFSWGQKTYTLISSIAEIETGKNYLIVSRNTAGSGFALGYQNSNNRPDASITVVNNAGVMTITTNVASVNTNTTLPYEVLLNQGSTSSYYTFFDSVNSGFLYAASSSSNYLRNHASPANDWTLTFSSGAANLTEITSGVTRNILKYNTTSNLFSCYSSGQSSVYLYKEVPTSFSVIYNGNTNTGGAVPTDGNSYSSGNTVTVLGNTGSLVKTGYAFNGWNTAANGSGTAYTAGSTFTITANTTLYAQWVLTSPPVITSSLTASGNVGASFSYDIVATNSPTSYNATGLPAGLSIDTATGEITGSVATAGVYNVTISATNAYGTDTETLVITITEGPCMSVASFSSTPSGWDANSVSYSSGEAVFGNFAGDLTTLAVSNPASLTFDLRRTSNSSSKDMIIEVSTTDQTGPFTTLFTYDHSNTVSSGTTACTVDLSAYTSFSTIYIRFRKASSTTSPWYLSNVNVFCGTPCTPAVVSVLPTSGPVGTEVTITASSGDLSGASVFFGGESATIVSSSATEIIAIVPSTATTGGITITDSQPCDATAAFTVITKTGSCGDMNELIMTEFYDESSGDLGYIEIYNGTGATIDLSTYDIERYTDAADMVPNFFSFPSGLTIASGQVLVGKLGYNSGPISGDFVYVDQGGINEEDIFYLRNNGVVVDVFVVPSTSAGYTYRRNLTTTGPNVTSNPSDWSSYPKSIADLGLFPYVNLSGSPTVNTNPVDVIGCTVASANFTVAATASGAGVLTYQWYFNNGVATGWTAVASGSFPGITVSGETTNDLSLTGNVATLNGYQFYCEVIQDGACAVASDAAQIKTSGTVWNGSTWSNGVPNIGMLAIIDGNYDTAVDGSFSCCSLVVNATYTLDIQAVDYVEIQYNLTNNGTLNVWDDGSLVQIDDSGVNTGNINYERITTGVNLDYVYWSSPVEGVNTPATGHVYAWDPDFANPNGGWGYWLLARNTPMAPGVGYIMRNVFNRTFTGVPRNGEIQPTIARANNTGGDIPGNNGVTITRFDDNWNLVGNPYPSAIRALDFLNANPNIEGAVRIWTHGTSPAVTTQPVYDSFVYNYTVNDYIVFNATGPQTGPDTFNGFIAGGQSFMINMDDGAAATETVTFNNAMRNRTHNNEQFYRQASPSNKSIAATEKHRIWLDLANANNNSVRTLVGYVTNATNGKDRMYDAVTNAQANEMGIYSIINDERMLIQGRTLPFDNQDKVQLAVNIPSTGLYSIGISALDGLFVDNQDIYLEDKELNIIFDLKQAPYSFYANKGEFKDRFILRYTNESLSINETLGADDLIVATLENGFNITSNKQNIKSVTIHNVLGQLLYNKNNVNSNTLQVSELLKNNQTLIINVVLENDGKIAKKVIF